MPSEITTTVVNAEVAAELDELADKYEEVAQKLRFQAEHLRKGFNITLQITASQKHPTPSSEELDGDVSDEEVKAVFDNHEGVNLKPLEPRDSELAKRWRQGSHFLPYGSDATTCGIPVRDIRLSWDEHKGDWVNPLHPSDIKARTTAKLKYVDCPDCQEKIRSTFKEPAGDIEWLMNPEAE